MKYDRTVIAYHGCDVETAERLLHGEPFKESQNDYDWLGEGIYFWEYGADRALQFAHDQQRRGKVKARMTLIRASAWWSVSVIGTVRRVRPLGVPLSPRQVCWFTVMVRAISRCPRANAAP